MVRILWTDIASKDIESIHAFIAKDSRHYADVFVAELIKSVDVLERFQRSGRVVPEYVDDDTREILYRNYRIIYDVVGDTVRILTVIHGARKLPDFIR